MPSHKPTVTEKLSIDREQHLKDLHSVRYIRFKQDKKGIIEKEIDPKVGPPKATYKFFKLDEK